MGIDIKCYPDGMYGENTYLITDDATGFKAIIDPGYYGVDVKMDIQNNAYLKYVLQVREDESLADQLKVQIPHKTLTEIRRDFEAKNGSIYVEP